VDEKIIATLLINQLVGSNNFTKKRELHQKQLTFMSIPVKRASHNLKQPKNNSVNIILITDVHVLSLHPMGN
jgi:DNA polymerase II small subunit/DNA polymerase delta subunit B